MELVVAGAGPALEQTAYVVMRPDANCTGSATTFYVQREEWADNYEHNHTFDLAVDWLARSAMESYFAEAYVQHQCYFVVCADLADFFIIEDKIRIIS